MFGKKKTSIGLDIGSNSIKCVELEKSDNVVTLKNFVIQPIYADDVRYDPEKEDVSQAASALSVAIREMGLTPKNVKGLISSLNGSAVNVKQIRTVPLTDEELETSLRFEARKHLPVTGSQMILDYQVLDLGNGDEKGKKKEKDSGELDVLLVVTSQKAFQRHVSILQQIELTPGIVDVEILAILNSYLYFNTVRRDEMYVFLNIGAERTNLAIFDPVGLFFARDLAFAGNHFTDDLIKMYEVDYDVAERIKREKGIFPSDNQDQAGSSIKMGGSISIAEKPVYESLLDEIHRSLRYYFKECGKNNFAKVILTGGSAKIPNIDSYLTEELNLPVEIYNPLRNLEISDELNMEYSSEPQLAQAIGLALRFQEK
jgi:type IV pilus assembly protein PilM